MLLTCTRLGTGVRISRHRSTTPTGKSSRQELTPFQGVDGKCRNQIQLTQKAGAQLREKGRAIVWPDQRISTLSLLAAGSEDTKVFSRPKTYAFIFKDLLLRRALFLHRQIPTSAKKLFQAFCKETSGQRGLQSIFPFTHICMGEAKVSCM